MIDAKLTGVEQAVANLKAIDAAIIGMIMDELEEVGEVLADEMNREDRLNVAHGTFTSHRRKKTVGVGPSRAGKRAHIVRFHEFGTVNHGATPLIRPIADRSASKIKTKMTKRVKEEIEKRKVK